MARKILLKTGGSTSPVPTGFKALIIDNNEQIALVGVNSKLSSYAKDSKSNTLISDAEYYAWGTYSIYPTDYWTTFKQGSDTFHLVDMRTVLPVHDFFDNDKQAEYLFGIFKENGSQLNFCGAFDPMELVDPLDYIESWRKVNEVVIPDGESRGTGYETSTNVSTIGSIAVQLDFDNVTPSNNLPIEAYANQLVTFTQTSTTGSGGTLVFEATFDESGYITSYSITGAGGNFVIDEVVTTTDPYAGSINVRISEISGGSGTGLTLDIEATDGEITQFTVNNGGTGYRVGDTITVLSGDENCQMVIQDVAHNNYTNNIFAKDFVKTDGGLKMINWLWDWDVANPYTNRYFELDITLSDSGSITGMTCSNFRNLQSPDNSSLEELNSGWTIGEFNYLDSYCQKSFADPRLWFYIRTNDSTDQIDYCKYDLVTNTIEVILEDIETWWGANADVDWTDADGNTISLRGGILPHPDKPLLLAYRYAEFNPNQFSGNAFDESFLIGPGTYHRFGDNKTTDYQTRLYTKNKIWIVNPILP